MHLGGYYQLLRESLGPNLSMISMKTLDFM